MDDLLLPYFRKPLYIYIYHYCCRKTALQKKQPTAFPSTLEQSQAKTCLLGLNPNIFFSRLGYKTCVKHHLNHLPYLQLVNDAKTNPKKSPTILLRHSSSHTHTHKQVWFKKNNQHFWHRFRTQMWSPHCGLDLDPLFGQPLSSIILLQILISC